MLLSRRLRRTTELANEPLDSENLSYAASLSGGNPVIVFCVRGSDGREYQVSLTDADIAAINHARNVCRDEICRAPVACKAFGYCLKLNME